MWSSPCPARRSPSTDPGSGKHSPAPLPPGAPGRHQCAGGGRPARPDPGMPGRRQARGGALPGQQCRHRPAVRGAGRCAGVHAAGPESGLEGPGATLAAPRGPPSRSRCCPYVCRYMPESGRATAFEKYISTNLIGPAGAWRFPGACVVPWKWPWHAAAPLLSSCSTGSMVPVPACPFPCPPMRSLSCLPQPSPFARCPPPQNAHLRQVPFPSPRHCARCSPPATRPSSTSAASGPFGLMAPG